VFVQCVQPRLSDYLVFNDLLVCFTIVFLPLRTVYVCVYVLHLYHIWYDVNNFYGNLLIFLCIFTEV